MIVCRCGYTCGTQAAFERHIGRFLGDPISSEEHGLPGPSLPELAIANTPSVSVKDVSANSCSSGASDKGFPEISQCPSPVATPNSKWTPTTCAPSPEAAEKSDNSPNFGLSEASEAPVRLLLVRHSESANKEKRRGDFADKDPGLTDHGFEQSEALCERLVKSCRRPNTWLVVSSPMRRCLLTILPAVQRLGLSSENCLCHGGCYEYSCAGTAFRGTPLNEIREEFPEFSPISFDDEGFWDYRGCHDKETEDECRERAQRIAAWLFWEVAPTLRSRPSGKELHTIVFVTHQSFADVLCQQIVDGHTRGWTYGDVRFRMNNASISEFILNSDGRADAVRQNDGIHLVRIRKDRGSLQNLM